MTKKYKSNCFYIDESCKSIQVFGYKIWIDNTSKKVFKGIDPIFSLLDGDEVFLELVFGHKCIFGITQKGSYKVYENEGITEFNKNNFTDTRYID